MLRSRAVGVRCRLAHARALHEHDGRHRERGDQQLDREEVEARDRRQREPGGDRAVAGDGGEAGVERRRDRRGHDECQEGADLREASGAQEDDDRDRGEPRQQGRDVDPAWVQDHGGRLLDRERSRRLGAGAGQVGDLAEHDVHGHPREESDHDRVRHETGVAPESGDACDDHRRPGEQREEEERAGAIAGREGRDRFAGRERGRAGGRDHHQLRAGGPSADDRPREARVQPVDRVHAGEDACRHAVGDAGDRTRDAGHRIRSERLPGGEPAVSGRGGHGRETSGADGAAPASSVTRVAVP